MRARRCSAPPAPGRTTRSGRRGQHGRRRASIAAAVSSTPRLPGAPSDNGTTGQPPSGPRRGEGRCRRARSCRRGRAASPDGRSGEVTTGSRTKASTSPPKADRGGHEVKLSAGDGQHHGDGRCRQHDEWEDVDPAGTCHGASTVGQDNVRVGQTAPGCRAWPRVFPQTAWWRRSAGGWLSIAWPSQGCSADRVRTTVRRRPSSP
jgi:hypothetical protein